MEAQQSVCLQVINMQALHIRRHAHLCKPLHTCTNVAPNVVASASFWKGAHGQLGFRIWLISCALAAVAERC